MYVKDVINFARYDRKGYVSSENKYNNNIGYIILIYEDDSCEIVYKYDPREKIFNTGGIINAIKKRKNVTKEEVMSKIRAQ